MAVVRVVQCQTPGCNNQDKKWNLPPRGIQGQNGLVEWPRVVCGSCGISPFLQEEKGNWPSGQAPT